MKTSHWSFCPPGGTAEHYLSLIPEAAGTLQEQIESLDAQWLDKLKELGLDWESGVSCTIYLSDSANQEPTVRASALYQRIDATGIACTLIQMPPHGRKLVAIAHHVVPAGRPLKRTRLPLAGGAPQAFAVKIDTGRSHHFLLRNLLPTNGRTIAEQSTSVFQQLLSFCKGHGVTLQQVPRTWIYVSDIDRNYKGMSDARNAIFDAFGLSVKTGFPASTGIEGSSTLYAHLILMDAMVLPGRGTEPGERMEAPGFMGPTAEYGVRFERGRALRYRDRTHYYVSGTASITPDGEILHVGDIAQQCVRAVANVDALLANHGASFKDLSHLVVYVRDPADLPLVAETMRNIAGPTLPMVVVIGRVCRPGWLVEIEGIAVNQVGRADRPLY